LIKEDKEQARDRQKEVIGEQKPQLPSSGGFRFGCKGGGGANFKGVQKIQGGAKLPNLVN